MAEYLEKNRACWEDGYDAPNVESFIFRFYSRILRFDYGIDGSKGEKVLDFGCGQGGALRFFDRLGFNCFGVDIGEVDVAAARRLLPHAANQIELVDPKPAADLKLFSSDFDIVISIQTLDFLSNTDFQQAVQCLYANMKKGAKIFVSMNGWDMYYRNHGDYVGDGLWNVKFATDRVDYDFFCTFVRDKDEMKERFSLFRPIYIDHYDSSFRHEGSEFRYTFFGVKD